MFVVLNEDHGGGCPFYRAYLLQKESRFRHGTTVKAFLGSIPKFYRATTLTASVNAAVVVT